jgi:hypothetical protein
VRCAPLCFTNYFQDQLEDFARLEPSAGGGSLEVEMINSYSLNGAVFNPLD